MCGVLEQFNVFILAILRRRVVTRRAVCLSLLFASWNGWLNDDLFAVIDACFVAFTALLIEIESGTRENLAEAVAPDRICILEAFGKILDLRVYRPQNIRLLGVDMEILASLLVGIGFVEPLICRPFRVCRHEEELCEVFSRILSRLAEIVLYRNYREPRCKSL